jgi:2-dehydropantoate 2-reductase
MRSPILIWGAGAIGGTVGACLTLAGHDVVFVDVDEAHVGAMRERGLAIEGPVRRLQTPPLDSYLPDQVAGSFERIFLCVKAHHTSAACEQLAPHLAPDGYVLSLQNGLNEIEIARAVGERRTIGAFVNFGADWLEPGRILLGNRGAFVIGELDGAKSARLQALAAVIADFEPDVLASRNIFGFLWGKLGYSCLLHAEALVPESIAECLADPEYRPHLVALVREVVQVARSKGVRLEGFNGYDPESFAPEADSATLQASFERMIAYNRASAKSHSGIWRDLAVRKRKTAVDAQIAPIADEAARAGLEAPRVRRLVALIHDIEDGRRRQERSTLLALAG